MLLSYIPKAIFGMKEIHLLTKTSKGTVKIYFDPLLLSKRSWDSDLSAIIPGVSKKATCLTYYNLGIKAPKLLTNYSF